MLKITTIYVGPYNLIHFDEDIEKPTLFNEDTHIDSFASDGIYPLYLDTKEQKVKVAINFYLDLPNIYVAESRDFHIGDTITNMRLH
jgi:hypothetical protein